MLGNPRSMPLYNGIAQRSERGSYIFGKCLRLLQGGKMPASGHFRPSFHLEGSFDPRSGRNRQLLWKMRDCEGYVARDQTFQNER